MKDPADRLISDFSALLADYRNVSELDRDCREVFKIAESALEMLSVVRQHQLERIAGEGTFS